MLTQTQSICNIALPPPLRPAPPQLEKKHAGEIHDLRARLMKKHADEITAAARKSELAMQKKLVAEHAQAIKDAIARSKIETEKEHSRAMAELTSNLERRSRVELEAVRASFESA